MAQAAPTVNTAPVQDFTLNAADRCDTCGSQAYYKVTLVHSGDRLTDLLFCAHHFRKSEDRLRASAIEIVDESSRLEEPQ